MTERFFLPSHIYSAKDSCQILQVIDFKQENMQCLNPNSTNPYAISHYLKCNSNLFHIVRWIPVDGLGEVSLKCRQNGASMTFITRPTSRLINSGFVLLGFSLTRLPLSVYHVL